MIEYRKMVATDIEAGLALCRSAGWNQLENDWNLFLELAPEGSRVAIDDHGKVVGTVATINYEDRFSWIGMVLVDPGKKRQGIGTQLLLEALRILERRETIKLDATPAGREVYLKLGFVDEYTLSRMVLKNERRSGNNLIKPFENDFGPVLEKDKEVFGASRKDLLVRIRKYHPELFHVIHKDSSVAYSFGRKGYQFTQIGPVVADTSDDAIAVATEAIEKTTGAVAMDVADNSSFQQWLISRGFTEQRKLIRMYKGANAYPGMPDKQFAILGPEFG